VVATEGKVVDIATSQRSSSAPQIDWAVGQMNALGKLAGALVTPSSGYPGWNPNLDSPLLKIIKVTNARFFGAEPQLRAIHAGLECGIIGEHYKGMDMISVGPQIEAVHSPDERVHIASVERFYNLLKEILKDLA
jgi:dipeptidase D